MGIKNYEDLTPLHLDVLKEIGNIGSGNASAALSNMINKNVEVEMPQVKIVGFQEAMEGTGGTEQIVAGVLSRMSGGMDGMILLLMDKPLPSCLAGGCLWYDIALDKITFICTPRNKRMAPGHSVRACIHSILCMISCSFVITDFLYSNRNNTCPRTRCIVRSIYCGGKAREKSYDNTDKRYNHKNRN